MRKIIFRGKKPDKNEWAEGCLIHTPKYCCILQDEEKVHPMDYPYLDNDTGCFDGYATTVKPETVGQYTGMTDKNGKKIFEGDIIKIDNKYIRYIEYSGECSAFVKFRYIYNLTSEFSGYLGKGYDNYKQTVEIIGNIHDNPELLKGGDKQ